MSKQAVYVVGLSLLFVLAASTWIYGQSGVSIPGEPRNNVLIYTEKIDAYAGEETLEILWQYFPEDQVVVGEEFYPTKSADGTITTEPYATYSFPYDPQVDAEIRRKISRATGLK